MARWTHCILLPPLPPLQYWSSRCLLPTMLSFYSLSHGPLHYFHLSVSPWLFQRCFCCLFHKHIDYYKAGCILNYTLQDLSCKSLKGPRVKTAPLITLMSTLKTHFYDFRESGEIDVTDVTVVGSEYESNWLTKDSCSSRDQGFFFFVAYQEII